MRIDIEIICPMCGEIHSVEVDLMQYKAWKNGELIQRAMPQLSATEREQLISHLCPKCQDTIFGSDDEEEDEEYDEPADIDDDFGFDPYMGEYTWDC